MVEMKNLQNFCQKMEGKGQLERPWHKWEDNIKVVRK
jgi:hypothetical protein